MGIAALGLKAFSRPTSGNETWFVPSSNPHWIIAIRPEETPDGMLQTIDEQAGVELKHVRSMRGPNGQGTHILWLRPRVELVGVTPVHTLSNVAASAMARSRVFRFLHPPRDIALAVQDAPDIDVLGPLDVEDDVGVTGHGPRAQAR